MGEDRGGLLSLGLLHFSEFTKLKYLKKNLKKVA